MELGTVGGHPIGSTGGDDGDGGEGCSGWEGSDGADGGSDPERSKGGYCKIVKMRNKTRLYRSKLSKTSRDIRFD